MSVELEKKPYLRLKVLFAVLIGFTFVLIAQLFRWQVLEHDYLLDLARFEHAIPEMIIPPRGDIMDCNSHLLATDIFQYEVSATPNEVEAAWETADRLSPHVGQPRQVVYESLTKNAPYVLLSRHVSQESGDAIRAWSLKGVTVKPRPKRVYPVERLAAHVLGFVNETHDGYYGVEGYYNTFVGSGEEVLTREKTPYGEEIISGPPPSVNPRKGQDLILTIDRAIQYLVERELESAVTQYKAEGGTIIVMDPRRGAILAMANYPTYDPNRFADTRPELFVNPSVSNQYEPGSVFKIITMAAGLDAGVMSPHDTFYDSGAIEVGGRTIMNWDRQGHGLVTMTDILARSLNVGAAYVSTMLGKEHFYSYVRRFGFGRITEVDLAGEGPGTLKLPGDREWHESDLGTNSFGQGIAVTPLQMITAVAAVANRGFLMKPYVVERIVEGDKTITVQPAVVRRAISASTATQLTAMLVEAVEREAGLALVPGYRIAGKTGTAQIPRPGGYDPYQTIASFVGYGPADAPQFIILVKIDKPQESPWGSQVAAPVFKSVARQLIVYLGIPPDDVRLASDGNREQGAESQCSL